MITVVEKEELVSREPDVKFSNQSDLTWNAWNAKKSFFFNFIHFIYRQLQF